MSLTEARTIVNRYKSDLVNFVEYENGFRFFRNFSHPEEDLVVQNVTRDVYSLSAYEAEFPKDIVKSA